MRFKYVTWIVTGILTFFVHTKCLATQGYVCDLLKKQKNAVAYLIDNKGNVETKTLNYGSVNFKSPIKSEYLSIKTNYKIVIYPANELVIEKPASTGADYLDFIKTNPTCPNTETFSIIIMKRIMPNEMNKKFKDDFEYELFSAVEYLDGGTLEINNPKIFKIVGQIKPYQTR